jgi:hypothetical protein
VDNEELFQAPWNLEPIVGFKKEAYGDHLKRILMDDMKN